MNSTDTPDSEPLESAEPTPMSAPLYADLATCPCGARSPKGALCRKCRARAAWLRRHTNEERHRAAPVKRTHPTAGRTDSRRPQGRRPNR